MSKAHRTKPAPADFLKQGVEAFQAGRYHLAAEAFSKAHEREPRNPLPLFYLGNARERTGDIDGAAVCFTRALQLRPGWPEPAQRLSLLLARYVLPTAGALDPHGLLSAFSVAAIDHHPIAAAAVAHLQAHGVLGDAIRRAAESRDAATDAARSLLLSRTDKTLTHPLLLAALSQAVNHDPAFEHLLTAMRRVLLLEVPPARFEDKALYAFAAALLQQCFNNEHVWAVSPAEQAALADLPLDWAAMAGGNATASRALLLHLLYAPPHAIPGGCLAAEAAHAIRPRALATVLAARIAEDDTLSAEARDIPVICAPQDETSARVARQYEASPYPRWESLFVPPKGSARRTLARFFTPGKLAFLDAPCKVLVAGAGTGQHAIAVAARYGDAADVLAVDLSRRSLAYGRARAAQLGASNLRFAQADIRAIPPEAAGPFDIIEAVGVLHHLADPFAGWQALLRLLRPGGLMAVGLYSATARRHIAELRTASGYPGPGCDDDAARTYRANLMEHPERAGRLLRSHDFYALSNFRDLLLHEHEQPVSLPEIDTFLQANGLVFRGFSMAQPLEAAFHAMFPEDAAPGNLANWAAFEAKHPPAFETMYQFWCEKV